MKRVLIRDDIIRGLTLKKESDTNDKTSYEQEDWPVSRSPVPATFLATTEINF